MSILYYGNAYVGRSAVTIEMGEDLASAIALDPHGVEAGDFINELSDDLRAEGFGVSEYEVSIKIPVILEATIVVTAKDEDAAREIGEQATDAVDPDALGDVLMHAIEDVSLDDGEEITDIDASGHIQYDVEVDVIPR